jgi:proteasome lid subunit RPN8/RPN11
MEDSLLQEDLIDKCKAWLIAHKARSEPVAAIVVQKGKAKLVPLQNISEDAENYFTLGNDFVKLSLNSDVLFIVHAHPDNCIASDYDVACCNNINIPYIIFNKQTLEYSTVYPSNYKDLIGREYVFGTSDCFEACRDWYLAHNIPIPSRNIDWEDDWWLKGLDYIINLEEWGFKETTSLQYGDLLIFGQDLNNHIGVYIDKDIFYHHAVNRLSCRENIYPFWGSMLKKVYRYEKSNIIRNAWR